MTKGEIDALIAEARGNIGMMVRDEEKWPPEITANYRRLADALSLLGTCPPPLYITSGPHLSGYQVCLGYETRKESGDAHQALAQSLSVCNLT